VPSDAETQRERIRWAGEANANETFAAAHRAGLPRELEEHVRERWRTVVDEISVEIRPGGRAVLRRPGTSYHVELQWAAKGSTIRLSEARVFEESTRGLEGGIPYGLPDIAQYAEALRRHLRSGHRIRGPIPGQRPMPGKAQNVKFYERVLTDYESLERQGLAAPAKELARRYGAKHSTMKAWLFRARRLREQKEDKE
jgi:hypothetical protein